MTKIKSWELSDKFWEKIKDLIPKKERDEKKKYKRKAGAGRKPIEARKVLEGYDYSVQGMYFVTICTQNRECIYGDIESGIFIANQAGTMIEEYWKQIENEFANIALDEYVIMPNHIHGVIFIVGAGLVSAQLEQTKTGQTQGLPLQSGILFVHSNPEQQIVIYKMSNKTIGNLLTKGFGNVIILNT